MFVDFAREDERLINYSPVKRYDYERKYQRSPERRWEKEEKFPGEHRPRDKEESNKHKSSRRYVPLPGVNVVTPTSSFYDANKTLQAELQ